MAVIKIGAPLTGISGTIGGITYSRNGSGTYAKPWAQGSNPKSQLQTQTRAILSGLTFSWQAITASQRALWDVYAALPAQELTNSLGDTFFGSGWNWFVRINSNLITTENAERAVPPTAGTPTAVTLNTFVVNETGGGEATITWPAGSFTGNQRVVVKGFKAISQARIVSGNIRSWKFSTTTPAASTRVDVELDTIYGSRPLGSRWFASVQKQNGQGRRSTATTIQANTV